MLQAVGTGVAMGNGRDEVKAVADYVTDHVDEDGVYKALEQFKIKFKISKKPVLKNRAQAFLVIF